jgi:hypothetical protein
MAKKRKPYNETDEQTEARQLLDTIANTATRGSKVSFDRKMDNMVSLLASLKPIEDKILDLMAQKGPIIDEIDALRKTMIKECIHPYTHLTVHNNTVFCKFCNKTFSVVGHDKRD